MKITSKLLLSLIALSTFAACHQDRILPVVPQPQEVTFSSGQFVARPSTHIVVPEHEASGTFLPGLLNAYFKEHFPEALEVVASDQLQADAINLRLNPELPREGYELKVRTHNIELAGGSDAGLLYGIQTLLQMFSAGQDGVSASAAQITDWPEFGYRGFMLDAARHFFTVDEVKELLDIMTLHKMNVVHWHLTDDQGWRIEIKKYPQLTEVGAYRKRTIVGKDPSGHYDEHTPFDNTPHGGFYTQDQIRDIVAYAAARNITVIPEIEFPGHAVAALASYPWLSCTGEQYEVRQTWDIDDRTFCIGKESTFEFMENVLKEVIGLFPSEYIHIGGDECPVKMWQKCPLCAQRMKEENISTERGLQGYALRRIEKFVSAYGKHIVGWDEILEAGIDKTAIVMSWRGTEGGVRAAKKGNRVIMSPTTNCYFDYYQSENQEAEPLAWGGYLPLETVYAFNPVEGLDEKQSELVLGVQANLWTEYIPDLQQAEYMTLPRLAALSEVAWTRRGLRNYENFSARLSPLFSLYEHMGWNYRKLAQNEE